MSGECGRVGGAAETSGRIPAIRFSVGWSMTWWSGGIRFSASSPSGTAPER
ncbi:hypothetical protein ACFV84_26845 [Kitasatospora sp. NPDC059811]|uniref:hypothetical protein n=1 Tax=unclassified Kitasatospora TaxID=2633591 RepID=UPI003664C5E0